MFSELGVIIVLYNPDKEKIKDFIQKVISADCCAIVVDNTPGSVDSWDAPEGHFYLPLKENTGIAYAQNVGIRKAKEAGCKYVIFFDQDSIIKPDFCSRLLNAYKKLEAKDPNVFLLGAKALIAYNPKRKIHTSTQEFIIKKRLISSGTISAVSKIDCVGELNEAMFIDWVDLEYIWRGYEKGLNSYMTPQITFSHPIGQYAVYLLGIKRLDISSPIRYYYQYRNALYLFGQNFTPLRWKIKIFLLMIFQYIFMPLLCKEWKKIRYYMRQGVNAWSRNESGAIPANIIK